MRRLFCFPRVSYNRDIDRKRSIKLNQLNLNVLDLSHMLHSIRTTTPPSIQFYLAIFHICMRTIENSFRNLIDSDEFHITAVESELFERRIDRLQVKETAFSIFNHFSA